MPTFAQMPLEAFLERLNKANPSHPRLADMFKNYGPHLRIFRKDDDLLGLVQWLLEEGLPPVIDQKLETVFGIDAHRMIRGDLYRYHIRTPLDVEAMDSFEMMSQYERDADAWTQTGMGYHFSSMHIPGMPYGPTMGLRYKPDRYDTELMIKYGFD